MQLVISILLLKISNLFSNCAQKSPWTSCLATPDNRYIVWLWWKHHDFWSCAMLYKVNASIHLLVKKLRERVTLTFTDPKMHYCCWVFECAEFRCSFVGMRPWPASQRKDSCVFSIICRCKSLWIQFRKSCSQRTHPTFTWQQARTEHKKWYVLLLLAWQLCQYSLKTDQDSHRKEVKSLQARSGSLCTQENLETETFCALVTCYIT